ncbi:bacteriodes thetaiotaomicron symbiotic chitinase, putative [Cordyceps militaris CM01]|uniref:chitinase n=1 Tax=Cordyceps militaris (strain CM01) TaxID=983644 RepID=G3JS97_CORMM|nr:bacteriodes thetaiotaomicron symbiotic chitinase, putative [Cordyceps militaris CM01]EGX88796.1 bacteriodes thetaiotaomicron symbiotic chitinase, putative [Cordyceps militaris CM01]
MLHRRPRPAFRGPSRSLCLFLIFFALLLAQTSLAQQDATCSETKNCKSGCKMPPYLASCTHTHRRIGCSSSGSCGFGPNYCGTGCKGTCNATAECGTYAIKGSEDCPINSVRVLWNDRAYIDLSDFCGDGCQKNSRGGGCGKPDRKSCGTDTEVLDLKRRIGYFNLDNLVSWCNRVNFDNIPLGAWTDLNLAFVNFGADYKLNNNYDGALLHAALLKKNYPTLSVAIAVGGWTFSDPPNSAAWSNMASTKENRKTFIDSVVGVLKKFGLDGVDLAPDRGGKPEDAANFVSLLGEMRDGFDAENPSWTISATIPTSYWYLRGFDLKGMQEKASWLNLMSYDLHGVWDHDNHFTGPFLRGHTDISEIQIGLDILRRNDIDMKNVVMGMAFYGRSFTVSKPNCIEPNGICEFATGGRPGSCSGQSGILTYGEISARNTSLDVSTHYNATTTVKFNVFETDQWISYDDAQSWTDKKKFLSEQCFGGLMVWSLDQDDDQFDALYGLMGDVSGLELSGGHLSKDAQRKLAHEFAPYTGQDCFVTPRCTDGSAKEQGPEQVCPGGYQSMATSHDPKQAPGHAYFGDCAKGWYRHICCPKDALPKHCEWSKPTTYGNSPYARCDIYCPVGKFLLNTDNTIDHRGEKQCASGRLSICCDANKYLAQCRWSYCQGPTSEPRKDLKCPDGYQYQTHRMDNAIGQPWCAESFGDAKHDLYWSALCCPTNEGFANCHWSNEVRTETPVPPGGTPVPVASIEDVCRPNACPAGEIEVANALNPPPSNYFDTQRRIHNCDTYQLPPGLDAHFPYCCDPPGRYNSKWPVDPEKLFEIYYNQPNNSDVVWSYSAEGSNNDRKNPSGGGGGYGDEAYGFVMLDGPEGSIDHSFSTTYSVVRKKRDVPLKKRSYLTSNQTTLDSVFDHAEEVFQIYCNFPEGAEECRRLWIDGPENTILRLPSHIGEGPFARLVYIKELDAETHQRLPRHHLEHRAAASLHGPVYEVKIDYAFHEIVPKDANKPVRMRVDFTNLHGYWDEMDEAEPDKKGTSGKRDASFGWHERVRRAVSRDDVLRKRSGPINVTVPMDLDEAAMAEWDDTGKQLNKRWWGTFTSWLARLTTVTKSEVGELPLYYSDKINLFSAKTGCPGRSYFASLKVDLEAEVSMDATYAYYLSGTFIPPSKPDVYAYFGMDPHAYLGLKVTGDAQLQYTSKKKKLIDTLSYPGLAVKGIAAVGPTLDVYGQIRGHVRVHGEMRAGAQVNFGKAAVFWPQDDAASQKYERLLGLDGTARAPERKSVEPRFEAGVRVDAQLDIVVQPQANMGVKIGGGKLVGGATIMDAQLSGFLAGTLSFQARAKADTGSQNFTFSYGVHFLYNIGYSAKAVILGITDWATGDRLAYTPDKKIDVYGPFEYTIPLGSKAKRAEIGAGEEQPFSANNSSMNLFDLRSDSDPMDTDSSSQFSTPITCPAGAAGWRLPELRFFGDTQVPGTPTGQAVVVPGMCSAWRTLNPLPNPLTFSADADAKSDRRKDTCIVPAGKKSYCQDIQDNYRQITKRRKMELDCDETPPASTEEGGIFLPAAQRSELCTLKVQNKDYGGSTCQQLVRNIKSNWGNMEPEPPSTGRTDKWVNWKSNAAWTKKGSGENSQRRTEYPEDMPLPDGIKRRDSDKISWVFRRNYTWSLNWSPNDEHGWWGATAREFKTSSHDANKVDGWKGVACAINLFDQDRYYGWVDDYNAYCLYGPQVNRKGVMAWHLGKCKVTFSHQDTDSDSDDESMGSGSASSEKRWTITKVERYEDDEEEQVFIPVETVDDVADIDDAVLE